MSRRAQPAWIALGSNLGDRAALIREALARLAALPGIQVECVSSLIETAPVGGPPGQAPYLNGAAALKTTCTPQELFCHMQAVETALGRDRSSGVRCAPRTIDLDLLLFDDQIISEPDLTVPHPRLHERLFVLTPLAEIAPRACHPILGRSILELLKDWA